jgi:drug/metabolite transporter (DMT)-like permease
MGEATASSNSAEPLSAHPLRGYIYIGGSAIFWGISASLGRAAFTGRMFPSSGIERINPLILSQARTTFSFVVVAIGLLMFRGPRRLRMPWRDLVKVLILGLGGVAASNYFYYLAIQRTNVATAIIVQYTAPIWVLLYMLARRIEKPTMAKMVSVLLAISGIALVIGLVGQRKLHLDSAGMTAALIAAFSFAYYNIGGHSILARYDRWMVLLYTTLSASMFWMCVNPPARIAAAHYSPTAWLFLFVFAILSVLMPFSFYFAGLQHLDPTKAIIASCLEPVFTVVIAAVALNEVVRPLQALGMAMVLAAIIVVQRSASDTVCATVGPVD